jgi:nitrate reductase NapE component
MAALENPQDAGEQADEGEPIEGGRVDELKNVPSFKPAQHRAQSSRILAITLLCMLGVTIVGHYGVSMWLRVDGHDAVADHMGKIFEVWLPIISSLASSATTYYFTKDS